MILTIIVQVFNEKSTILQAIKEAKGLKIDKEIIVIDNHSTNGTREMLKNLEDSSLQIVFQPKNLGPGGTVQTAADVAKGDYIHFFHADLEYKAEDVYKMLQKAEEENLDAVFGSRLAHKKHLSKMTLIKERPYVLATLIATSLINKWYKKSFTDVIATKLIKVEALKEINCEFKNQGSEFEVASKLCKRGYKIGEVPVSYKPRSHQEGKKIKAIDMIPALHALFKVRFFYRKKRKPNNG